MNTIVEAKGWWKSWTIWLGIVSLLAAFLDGILQLEVLPDGAAEGVAAVLGVLNIVLRFKSDRPVAMTDGKVKAVGPKKSAGW